MVDFFLIIFVVMSDLGFFLAAVSDQDLGLLDFIPNIEVGKAWLDALDFLKLFKNIKILG